MKNFYTFVVKRLNSHTIHYSQKVSFSKIASRIAIASIAIGLAIILIAFGILKGFEQAIQEKIFSFNGHFQVTFFDLNNSYQDAPITTKSYLYQHYKQIPIIAHAQLYAQKPAIIKANEEVQGVLLKGITTDFYWQKFKPYLIQGRPIKFAPDKESNSAEIMISKRLANKLQIKLKDTILMYFVQNPPRFRKLQICAIYETGMEDLDDKLVFGDLKLIRKLNNWADTTAGGYEIFIKDFEQYAQATQIIYDKMAYDMRLERMTDKFVAVFDWMILLQKNVYIFLGLILIVACFNMLAILLILIMERTQMIGILKAIGATHTQIQKIFVFQALYLILKGLFWGNFIGLGFCIIQYYTKIIPLDVENYYMYHVPIAWDWRIIISLNILTFILILATAVIPARIIIGIKPIKAIRFD